MKYPRLAALLALSVAALAPAGAAARFWDIQAPGVGYLNVVDGRPVLQKSSVVLEGDWNLSFPAEKTSISVHAGKRSGWHLAYDLKGKDPAVTLAPPRKDGKTLQWEVAAQGGWYRIRAAQGKFKGWYLDVQKGRGKGGAPRDSYRLILTEKPKRPLTFTIVPIGN